LRRICDGLPVHDLQSSSIRTTGCPIKFVTCHGW
jgi:hypothetical protein